MADDYSQRPLAASALLAEYNDAKCVTCIKASKQAIFCDNNIDNSSYHLSLLCLLLTLQINSQIAGEQHIETTATTIYFRRKPIREKDPNMSANIGRSLQLSHSVNPIHHLHAPQQHAA
jgi:hypothetical protein